MLIAYEFLFLIYVCISLPLLLLKGKWHRGFFERCGCIPKDVRQRLCGKNNIWVHAVSVGEVIAIGGIIGQLKMRFSANQIVLTTSTQTGYELAKAKFSNQCVLLWSPLDFSFIVNKFINVIKPKVYVAAETELWPSLFYHLYVGKAPIIIVNGRISDQSYPKYQRIRWFIKRFLGYVSSFCMQSALDAQRIISMGAVSDRVRNFGNIKFDDLPEDQRKSKQDFGFLMTDEVWVSGSTHPGEEIIVLNVFQQLKQKYPHLRLIIAPRHVQRSKDVARIIQSYGFDYILLSQISSRKSSQDIVLVDTIGQLKMLYSAADFVFVGKSLTVPGGHNIIEPAFYGKPIVVGPHMQNFRDVMLAFLKAEAIIEIKNQQELLKAIEDLLDNPQLKVTLGQRAQDVVTQGQGATKKIIDEISRWIKKEI